MLSFGRKTLRSLQPSGFEQNGNESGIQDQQKAKVSKDVQKQKRTDRKKKDTIHETENTVCHESALDFKKCSEVKPETDSEVIQKDSNEQNCNEPEKSSNEDILDWLTKPQVSDSYWKELAEQRRLALEEALAENEELYETIETLKKENETLKQVNESLQDMADEAHRLGKILQELTGELDEETPN